MRKRRAIDLFIESIKETAGYFSSEQLSVLLEDYIRKDLLKKRNLKPDEETYPYSTLNVGLKLKEMPELDQEMLLFLLEVDGALARF